MGKTGKETIMDIIGIGAVCLLVGFAVGFFCGTVTIDSAVSLCKEWRQTGEKTIDQLRTDLSAIRIELSRDEELIQRLIEMRGRRAPGGQHKTICLWWPFSYQPSKPRNPLYHLEHDKDHLRLSVYCPAKPKRPPKAKKKR